MRNQSVRSCVEDGSLGFITWVSIVSRLIIIGAISGGIAGLVVGGFGGRAAMMVVAMSMGVTTSFDPGATAQMLLGVTYRGIAVGVLFALSRSWFPGPTLRRAVTFGTILVVLMLVFAFATNWKKEFSHTLLAVSVTMFGAIFFAYGAVAEVILAAFDRVVPSRLPLLVAPILVLMAVPTLIAGGLGLLIIVAKDLISGG